MTRIASLFALSTSEGASAAVHSRRIVAATLPARPKRALANGRRVQRVEIFDATTGALLIPAHQLATFGNGIYLKYLLSGSITVVVSQQCTGGADAMINALFFDHA